MRISCDKTSKMLMDKVLVKIMICSNYTINNLNKGENIMADIGEKYV